MHLGKEWGLRVWYLDYGFIVLWLYVRISNFLCSMQFHTCTIIVPWSFCSIFKMCGILFVNDFNFLMLSHSRIISLNWILLFLLKFEISGWTSFSFLIFNYTTSIIYSFVSTSPFYDIFFFRNRASLWLALSICKSEGWKIKRW